MHTHPKKRANKGIHFFEQINFYLIDCGGKQREKPDNKTIALHHLQKQNIYAKYICFIVYCGNLQFGYFEV